MLTSPMKMWEFSYKFLYEIIYKTGFYFFSIEIRWKFYYLYDFAYCGSGWKNIFKQFCSWNILGVTISKCLSILIEYYGIVLISRNMKYTTINELFSIIILLNDKMYFLTSQIEDLKRKAWILYAFDFK